MSMHMPQEIEVWYVLPSLRKELARIFVKEKKKSQKATATLLGLTESAVSQYLKKKRGKEFTFTKNEVDLIREAASKMEDQPSKVMNILFSLSKQLMGCETVCKFHRELDGSLPKNCDVCKCYSK